MKLTVAALAFITLSIGHASPLSARADIVGRFDVYNLALCATTGVAVEYKEYPLPAGQCTNTPPNPNAAALPYLSFRANVEGGVPAGKMCFFDIFAGTDCTGNYMGFTALPENAKTCQEVLVGTTGSMPQVGGRSVRLGCRTL